MKNKKMKVLISTIAFCLLLVGGILFYNSIYGSEYIPTATDIILELEQAEDFYVFDKEGNQVYLSDFKDGKPIMVSFWSSKCKPCVVEMPVLQKLYNEYKNDVHFIIIGASSESEGQAKDFIESYGYTFTAYYDLDYKAAKALHLHNLPTSYLIDKNFNLVRGGAGTVTFEMVSPQLDELIGE